jgi:hypothetical protein
VTVNGISNDKRTPTQSTFLTFWKVKGKEMSLGRTCSFDHYQTQQSPENSAACTGFQISIHQTLENEKLKCTGLTYGYFKGAYRNLKVSMLFLLVLI